MVPCPVICFWVNQDMNDIITLSDVMTDEII